MKIKKFTRVFIMGASLPALGGCDSLLDVQDPSRFTDEDLDGALTAVANGVEGLLNGMFDGLTINSAILGDEMQHTGTWSGWDDTDHGRIIYDRDGRSDFGSSRHLLRARFAAQDAQARFDRVGGVSASLYAQVEVVEGWTDLLLAMHYCEAPSGQNTGVITDVAMFTQARDKLTLAMATAAGAGATDYERWARAGIARAELFLGNDAAAAAAAGGVPDGWSYSAVYQISTQENLIVNLATEGVQKAAGIREKWWPLVDLAERKMNDPLSRSLLGLDEPDPRVPIRHDAGPPASLGVDGITLFYSQWKYQAKGDGIRYTSSEEMRLIEAEVDWRAGNLTTAMTTLNALRTDAGLSPITATTSAEVFAVLMNEHFAELFMEGQRTPFLVRHGLIPDLMAAGDFVGTVNPRAVKFPLDNEEAQNNPNIEDNASARCLPQVSSS